MAASLSEDDDYVYTDQNDEVHICTESDVDRMVEEDIKLFTEYVKSKSNGEHPLPDFKTYYVQANVLGLSGIPNEMSFAVLIDTHYSCVHSLLVFRIIFGKFRGTTFYLQTRHINKEAVMIPDLINAMKRVKAITNGFGDHVDKQSFKDFRSMNKDFMERAYIIANPERTMDIIRDCIDTSILSLQKSLTSYFTVCPQLKQECMTAVFSAVSRMKRELDKKEDMPGKGKRMRSE
jgi:hypothetical protein